MRKILFTFFFIFLSFMGYASDYDAFILNFLRVNPSSSSIQVEMVLAIPPQNNIEKSLKEGQILKFSIYSEVLKVRTFFPSKAIAKNTIEYYLRYDPLTRQFMVIQQAQPSIQNTDLEYLLSTLMHNLEYTVPANIEQGADYIMNINVSLTPSTNQAWRQSPLFFLPNNIIQPAQFEYKFSS